MDPRLLAAALLSLAGAAVHTFAGERTDIRHLMASPVPLNEKLELRAVWHAYGITMLAASVALVAIALRPDAAGAILARGIGALFVLHGIVTLATVLATDRRALLRVPQWLLMLAIGALAWWGAP